MRTALLRRSVLRACFVALAAPAAVWAQSRTAVPAGLPLNLPGGSVPWNIVLLLTLLTLLPAIILCR